MRSWDTVAKCPIPLLTLHRHITPKDDQITTLCTPWITLSVPIARNPSAHASIYLHMPKVQSLEAEILNILKLSWNAQGSGPIATVLQGSIHKPRTVVGKSLKVWGI